jgi:hypothetical protein
MSAITDVGELSDLDKELLLVVLIQLLVGTAFHRVVIIVSRRIDELRVRLRK